MKLRIFLLLLVSFTLSAGAGEPIRARDAPFSPETFAVSLEPVATGLDQPVYVIGAPDDTDRLFVVERPGRIRLVEKGLILPEPFLDITSLVQSGGSEQGLLSMAFAADFESSGEFYVFYTARSDEGVGDNTVARFQISRDEPRLADAKSGTVILAVPDSRVNHNGGQLQIGPDGLLYIGLGDGGGAGDPDGNGQNPMTLLGSLLRIRPEGNSYSIPSDNPFADGESGAPEVWVWGVRNPWRFSFDRDNGDVWIGDVGQGQFEEIDWLPFADAGGANLGWNVMEGKRCYREATCDGDGLTLPIADYAHDLGCSVVGGYVYRGEREPVLGGVYLFADFCSGRIWGLGRDATGDWVISEPVETGLNISSFGEDAGGEMYAVDLGGGLYRVRAN
ncbi:MAG: PQQ-dependent sugar dehydrogenase [Thermomicrobiales bacterium]